MRPVTVLGIVVTCLSVAANHASAQEQVIDVSAGYSLVLGSADREQLHGVIGSFAGYRGPIGIVLEGGTNLGKGKPLHGDLDLVYGSIGTRYVFSREERVSPYVQALIGMVTGAGGANEPRGQVFWNWIELGGGVDVWRGRDIGIRFGADYLVSLSGSRYNKVRAQLGLVFKRAYVPRRHK
jgi:hypothetical protein